MGQILITGCGGYIGSRLAAFLLKKGHKIVGISRHGMNASFPFYEGDIRDKKLLGTIMSKEYISVVFHLAALLKSDDEKETWDINVNGTKSVAMAFSESSAKKIIFASSAKAYGKMDAVPVREEDKLNPRSPYGKSKAEAENVLRGIAGKQVIVFRQTYLYGKGMPAGFLIPDIIRQMDSGAVTLRNADVKRDFIHIDDLIGVYFKALETPVEGTFNISCGKSITLRDAAHLLAAAAGKKITVKSLDLPEDNQEELLDIEKIKRVLGWDPSVGYKEGFRRCV
ncbi:MAG: NAD(P)-dependent oxidoreductase [Candidatus Aenigmarchaeota archaeon]|nr:NAD(P)-dependent oxidoreductase [Candidatus Aenigmarchaeota archaeon]